MKDIIDNYYNLDIDEYKENKNYLRFHSNKEIFYFVFFNRTIDELKDLLLVSSELKERGIRVHDIILNKDNQILTKVGDNYYILLKLNTREDEIITFNQIINYNNKLRLNNKSSKLYRNNWGYLWSKKVDYFEYQIKEIGKDKRVVLDSFSYYIGLAENAISYVNKINNNIGMSNYDNITLAHRRIFYPNYILNYLNPLSFIFDLEVRDIAEYLKSTFFNNNDSILDLKLYLQQVKLTPYSYHMLFARLLYPSYYFDLYEDIMNNNSSEESIIKIINKVDDYEYFLKQAYIEISKYTRLEKIEWLLKKELNN
jgi:spore coat protein YutH